MTFDLVDTSAIESGGAVLQTDGERVTWANAATAAYVRPHLA